MILTAASDASVRTLTKLLLRGMVSCTANKSTSFSHSSTGAPPFLKHSNRASYLALDVSERLIFVRSSSIRTSSSGPLGSLGST